MGDGGAATQKDKWMKKYNIIYSDPPWQSEPGWWNNKAWKVSKFEEHYETMSVNEICALPIKDIAASNAHLYLWATSRDLLLGRACQVCEAWGFRPMNVITWCKTQKGLGNYFRNDTEHLVFGVRGQMSTTDATNNQGTHFMHGRGRHSAKPPIVRNWIVAWSGDLPRIELFARRTTTPSLFNEQNDELVGWDAMGYDISGKSIEQELDELTNA